MKLITAALVLLACAAPAPGVQDAKPPIINQNEVDNAIKKGAEYLISVARNGIPQVSINADKGVNYDGLVLYTLVHAGADLKDGAVRRLIDTVKNMKVNRTYTAAMNACALAMIDPDLYRKELAICAQYLVDTQCENGQWTYGPDYEVPVPVLPVASGDTGGKAVGVKYAVKKSKKVAAPQVGDNSNSQYAALGLWAAAKSGADVEQGVLDKAIKWWEGSQQADGGWGYCWDGKHDDKQGSFGSMTAGGAGSVVILRRLKGQDGKATSAKKGMSWLAEHWSIPKNPNCPQDREIWSYYYLYALERLGDLFPVDKMGKHHWYAEGADHLIKSQKGGMWQYTGMSPALADTCFAILFLKRSMAVSTHSAGDKPKVKEDDNIPKEPKEPDKR